MRCEDEMKSELKMRKPDEVSPVISDIATFAVQILEPCLSSDHGALVVETMYIWQTIHL